MDHEEYGCRSRASESRFSLNRHMWLINDHFEEKLADFSPGTSAAAAVAQLEVGQGVAIV